MSVAHAVSARLRERVDAFREWRFRRRLAGQKLVRALVEAKPDVVFVEIGASDGEQHDHLAPFIRSERWSGVMVEPVPYVFERLRENYGDVAGVRLENAAIAESDGHRPFYHLAEAGDAALNGLPAWYSTLGTFSREVLMRHARDIPDIERRIVTTEVETLTFESLRRKHGLTEIDLLLIDTEGYDWEIVRTIDFETQRPRLLVYEHFHLSPDDRRACRAHVERAGYETMEEHFDTFCVIPHPDDALTRAWRRARPALPGISVHDVA